MGHIQTYTVNSSNFFHVFLNLYVLFYFYVCYIFILLEILFVLDIVYVMKKEKKEKKYFFWTRKNYLFRMLCERLSFLQNEKKKKFQL